MLAWREVIRVRGKITTVSCSCRQLLLYFVVDSSYKRGFINFRNCVLYWFNSSKYFKNFTFCWNIQNTSFLRNWFIIKLNFLAGNLINNIWQVNVYRLALLFIFVLKCLSGGFSAKQLHLQICFCIINDCHNLVTRPWNYIGLSSWLAK